MKIFYLMSIDNTCIPGTTFHFYRFVTDDLKHGFVKKTTYPDTTTINVYDFMRDEESDVTGFTTNYTLQDTIDLSWTLDETEDFKMFNSKHEHGQDLLSFHLKVLLDYTKTKYYEFKNKKLEPGDLVKLAYKPEDVKAIELAYSSGMVTNSPFKKFGSHIDSTFVFVDILYRNRMKALIELKGEFGGKEFIISINHLIKA